MTTVDQIRGDLSKMESKYEKTFQDSSVLLHHFQSRLNGDMETSTFCLLALIVCVVFLLNLLQGKICYNFKYKLH